MSERSRPGAAIRRAVHQLDGDAVRSSIDTVVTEEPLEIRLGWPGQPPLDVAVVMRTPGHDFELAAGYLLSEGVLTRSAPPKTVAYCVDKSLGQAQRYNVVTVAIDQPPARLPSARSTAVSSACGVCGAQSLDEVFVPGDPPMIATWSVSRDLLSSMPVVMRSSQVIFDRTGSVHAAAAYSLTGDLLVLREDIGRHNAVDKVLGARVLGTATYGEEVVLCTSGRVGFDIVTKAVAGRIPMIVAVGGPSSLALDLATRAGITVCGFVRSQRLVVYTAPERVAPLAPSTMAVGENC